LGRFNSFAKAVILRVNEAHDLGDAERINRFSFYDRAKLYTAAPPDVLRVDESLGGQFYARNACRPVVHRRAAAASRRWMNPRPTVAVSMAPRHAASTMQARSSGITPMLAASTVSCLPAAALSPSTIHWPVAGPKPLASTMQVRSSGFSETPATTRTASSWAAEPTSLATIL